MYWYRIENGVLASPELLQGLETITEEAARQSEGAVLRRNPLLGARDRGCFLMNDPGQWLGAGEDVGLLNQGDATGVPAWIADRIREGRVYSVNPSHDGWDRVPEMGRTEGLRIHLVGLGDVGGVLLTGLRLLGAPEVARLGLYDPDPARVNRWVMELGQICFPFEAERRMTVGGVETEQLFDCDLFVFCASRGVPPVGAEQWDVRTVQYLGNAEILKPYAQQAVRAGFKGLFAVVSDPVDQLCAFALAEMQRLAAEEGLIPLKPEQVRGYGLGVMNGRAEWYAAQDPELQEYLVDGRAYGPHGQGLIIANSLRHYDEEKSLRLTKRTEEANLEVRHAGYKPFVAPALSSGAISLLHTLRGNWHYSAVSLGGVFIGCRNRIHQGAQETECLPLPEGLRVRLEQTYAYLRDWK